MWNPYERLSPGARRGLGIGAVVVVLLVWAGLSGSGMVGPAKLPTPWAVVSAFFRLAWDADPPKGQPNSLLLTATMWSVGRIVVASTLVMLIGIPIGVLMGASPRVNAVLSPLVDPFRAAPVVAISPILIMWFGIDEGMKIAFLFCGAVVYLVPMVRDAVRAVPQAYWMSARDLGATPFESVRLVLVPLAMPRIADAIIAALSIMWTYITVAEYVNATAGLGQLIQNARRFSAMDQVFVGIFVIIALALVTYQGLQKLKAHLFSWETRND
ncbi:MAG: ABC transporter permease [Deltaproteobacteria bacterium]|nr:ABC transporter permease [Deltaproteobacteria bacterium]